MDGERDGRQGTKEDGGVGEMMIRRDDDDEEEEEERLREMQISITASSAFPGFRFSPTDEELICYYLKKKMEGCDKSVMIIPEVDFCRHEPWELPGRSIIQSDNEWFFFSARGRKYPNGSQSKRATESGYWKATGKERNVKSGSSVIGTKRTLVFHTGRAPKGERTEWIMHEYCMDGTSQDSLVVCRLRRNSDFHLNETPRRRSQDLRDLSDGHNSAFALSEGIPQRTVQDVGHDNAFELSDGIPQAAIDDGAKGADSCSKECNGCYNSHSDEQNDSESEFNQRLANGSSQHGSSTFDKFCDGDGGDDWFADIMKDDIVKLDEASLSTSQSLVPLVVRESEVQEKSKQSAMSDGVPSQGTADRRIRLRKQRAEIQRKKPLEAAEGSNVNRCVDKVRRSLPQQRCVVSVCTDMVDVVVQRRSVSLILVVLTLLVLFASLLGRSLQVKSFHLFPSCD